MAGPAGRQLDERSASLAPRLRGGSFLWSGVLHDEACYLQSAGGRRCMESNRGETANQQVLGKAKADLLRRFPTFGRQLVDFLERDESRVVYAKDWGSDEAALRVLPAPAISNQFDISLEIPVLIANFEHLQPRMLRRFDTSGDLRGSASADKDIAVLVAADRRAHDLVRDRKRFAFPVLVIDAERLGAGEYTGTDLRTELSRLLRSVDHFDYSNEITTAADFFGRRDDIEALSRLAIAGQSVGVFGLRRAGKTSLLYRVRAELRDRGVGSIYLQLNALLDADAFRGEVLRGLDELAAEKGHKRPPRDPSVAVSAREWIYGMDEILDLIDEQVVIIIDEIDLANEDAAEFEDSEIRQRQELNRVLQQLRGIIQIRNDRSKHRLSFLVAGVAMSVFTKAVRFGRENQLFGFASARPLKPMTREEMREMVRTLGKRSGLKFNDYRLFDMLFAEYGGHPHLTRRACSAIAEAVHAAGTSVVPYPVTVADLQRSFEASGENSPSAIAYQTFRAFARWYPEEGELVDQLIDRGQSSDDLNALSHAIDFGLCSANGSLRVGALARRG
jgi:hypothetical protein